MEKEEKICLSSAYDLTLRKIWVCRVSDLEHSANRFMAPHTCSSLWFENEEKNKTGLPSARNLALGKAKVCRVLDHGHSATYFVFFHF